MLAPGASCRHCGVPLTDATWSIAQRRWKNAICSTCYKTYQRSYFEQHRRHACDRQRERNRTLRAELLAAYGGTCACCGETTPEFLTLDHVDGDGQMHRAALTGGSYGLARWLRDRGWPRQGFQLLCWNCNKGKYACGECPHRTAHQEEIAR